MPYFAKIQPTANASIYTVTDVISADQSFIDGGYAGDPSQWIQTSYNTYGNVHYAPSPPAEPMTPDGGTPLHYNYAGIGYSWDGTGFAAPQPYPSWVLDPATYLWEAPISYPTDGSQYNWDETTQSWIPITTIATI